MMFISHMYLGWNLPKVTKMAPEFYDNLYKHHSWCYVLYRFITDPTVSPFNRMIRKSRYDNGEDSSSAAAVVVDNPAIMSTSTTTAAHLKSN